MRRLIATTVLALTASAAVAAVPGTDIRTSNQVLESSTNALTINHVSLPRSGQIVAVAPNAYGRADNGEVLGETAISAGNHSDVRLPINQKALAHQDYTPGTNHQVILMVRPDGDRSAAQSIKVRVPDPADQID